MVSHPEGATPFIPVQIRPGMSLSCNTKFHGALFLVKLFIFLFFIFLPCVLLVTVDLHKRSY